jgi:lipopolysaccharide export system permease protein
MSLIERYLFRQILNPVLLATVALTAVAIISQSLRFLELIVERGQSAWVLVMVTALTLPQMLSIMLPVSVFVGALVGLNRLHTEQEIVVCYAGGIGRWRVISPAVKLGVLVTLLALFMNLFVQPPAQRATRAELFKVRTDLASTLVKEGEFVQAADGLTIYAQRVDQNGLMKNLFINIETPSGSSTYTAQEGRVSTAGGAPALLMRNGSNQELSKRDVLNFLSFEEYSLDLSPYVQNEDALYFKESDRFLHELMFPNPAVEFDMKNRLNLLREGHSRLATPLYNLAFMCIALASVLGGAFSRTGYGRRIAVGAAWAVLTRILGFVALAAAAEHAWLNVLQYLIPISATVLALKVIFRQRASRFIPLRLRRAAFGAQPA